MVSRRLPFTAACLIFIQLDCVLAAGSCSYVYTEPAGYTKMFEDNFDGPLATVGQKWWIWNNVGAFNNELQCYRNSSLSFAGGIMNITAAKPSKAVTCASNPWNTAASSYAYTSGRLETIQTFGPNSTYPVIRIAGRVQVGAMRLLLSAFEVDLTVNESAKVFLFCLHRTALKQLPPGYGMWGALWAYGADYPTNGEIDIVEAQGQLPTNMWTNYFYGPTKNGPVTNDPTSSVKHTTDVSLQKCFHTYEVIWEKTKLTYLLDGVVIATKYDSATTPGSVVGDLWGKQQSVVLNLAVGGSFFGSTFKPRNVVPGTMRVDWVKVYSAQTP